MRTIFTSTSFRRRCSDRTHGLHVCRDMVDTLSHRSHVDGVQAMVAEEDVVDTVFVGPWACSNSVSMERHGDGQRATKKAYASALFDGNENVVRRVFDGR